jgi:hypothetical protein
MNQAECIELAKAYVALSNSHNVAFILPMFTEQSIYHSIHAGEFKGRDAIGKMMADFFRRYPDVVWNVPEYRMAGERAVEFDFVMTATEALSGECIERNGTERTEFSDDGYITHLKVS